MTTEQPLYYAEGRNIHKRPIEKKVEGATLITIGFRAAVATQEVGEEGAKVIAELMNRGEKFDALLEALTEVKEWIDNWSPNFTNDDEWPGTAEKMRAALASATGTEGA